MTRHIKSTVVCRCNGCNRTEETLGATLGFMPDGWQMVRMKRPTTHTEIERDFCPECVAIVWEAFAADRTPAGGAVYVGPDDQEVKS